MLFTILIGLGAFLFIYDHYCKKHRVKLFKKANITGPVALPILGCGLELSKIGAETIIQYVGECFQKYGKTFRIWILNEAQVYTMDTKYFEAILSSTSVLQKGDLYKFLRPFLNDGLLLSVGRKWHARRKIFTPAFHFKVLERYVQVFDRQSGIMAKKLESLADGKTEIDMFSKVCLAALDVITETAMGVQVNAQLDPEFSYVKALKNVVYIQPNRMLNFSQRYNWLYRLTAPREYRKLIKDVKVMHDFTIKVIEERRAEVERSMADGTYRPIYLGDEDIGRKQQMALLDILLQPTIDGTPSILTNKEICEEVDTFMFEGDDTTTSCVSHALYRIARHPEVQKKLLAEIVSVLGNDKDAPVTMKQLHELKYLECVIKETLRLHPPVPSVGRKVEKDIDLDGTVIPANTSIYLAILYAHRDPDNFPDPDAFKPERFIEDMESHATFAFTPFSAGPRNCIGQKFAMLEVKSLISKMMRYYELLPLGADLQPMMNFILRSSTGINIGLKPRVYDT